MGWFGNSTTVVARTWSSSQPWWLLWILILTTEGFMAWRWYRLWLWCASQPWWCSCLECSFSPSSSDSITVGLWFGHSRVGMQSIARIALRPFWPSPHRYHGRDFLGQEIAWVLVLDLGFLLRQIRPITCSPSLKCWSHQSSLAANSYHVLVK